MRIPTFVGPDWRGEALDVLACYYGLGAHAGHDPFTGARFDTWDNSGTRRRDADKFTADDLVAVSLLSVQVPATAALELLDVRAEEFSHLLRAVGDDRDLVEETQPWSDDWAGWTLWTALTSLPGVGATVASKLYARKRPRLRPIYDSVVAGVIGGTSIWEPLRATLQDDLGMHEHLSGLRQEVGLSEEVSALRVFDALAWMEGKGYCGCRGR